MGIINRFPRWLAILKWDPFIWEPTSELVSQIKRHPPLSKNVVQMDEASRHWRSTNHSQNSIMDKWFHTNGPHFVKAALPEETKNKYWWRHLADNLSILTSCFSTLQTQLYHCQFYNQHFKMLRSSPCVLVKLSPRAQAGQLPQWELSNVLISWSSR